MKASVEMVQPPSRKDNYREVCNSAPSSERENYLFGCTGGLAGAGCVFTGCDLTPCRTEVGAPLLLLAYTANVMEVTMNATADHVVAFERALAAPRGPNAVWLP